CARDLYCSGSYCPTDVW
nr:immunoglobulin heavy chain junction region [Macaca mulatta]MOV45891.1 immunoglobulin heavy chain junction region [Macaca mulatta]MOV46125.1 immunoglobulin heavy chain junction region [Macaca mulatta]MOV46538.1 immunoglobulin heavy chain junction region [Macaca mulatta]